MLKQGFLDVNLLLNCNKIKKLEATKEDIIEAITKSEAIELNESKDKLRRKDNKALPEFKLLNKKREGESSEKNKEKEKKDKLSDLTYDPYIFI